MIDERVLGRVRALLAKAESTPFDEEAEALTAKAHELMARYAIDRALVDDGAGGSGASRREVTVDPPYPSAKFFLLGQIAAANRCQAVWSRVDGVATIVGFPVDAEVVEILYTSLLVQATTAMLAHGRRTDRRGRNRTRSFRHSFLLAFAARVGERLAAQTKAAEEQAAAATPGTDLVPVLADRAAAVDAEVRRAFPHLAAHRVQAGSGDGVVAGLEAGEQADLLSTPKLR